MLGVNENHQTLLIRYFVSGLVGAVVNILILYLLEGLLGYFYLYSVTASYFSGFVVAFLFHKYWTYKDGNHLRLPRQLIFYSIVAGSNYFLNISIMYFSVNKLGMGVIVSQIIIIILLGIIGYIVNTRHTFKDRNEK